MPFSPEMNSGVCVFHAESRFEDDNHGRYQKQITQQSNEIAAEPKKPILAIPR